MLISRQMLVTAVMCLGLLASASVAGAGVTILSAGFGSWGHVTPAHIEAGVWWSGGEGSFQDAYAGYYETPCGLLQWFEGGYSEYIHGHVDSDRISYTQGSTYWMSGSLDGPSWMGHSHEMYAAFEVTAHHWMAATHTTWVSNMPHSYFDVRDLGTGDWIACAGSLLYEGPVLLTPGTYCFELSHEWFAYDIGFNGYAFDSYFEGGIEFELMDIGDPIPEPAYLSFVAVAIFGLAEWRKRAKRLSAGV